jgi:hypothetical protein
MDSDTADAHQPQGANDANGDLATIGDKNGLEYWHQVRPLQPHGGATT